ncbi:hypothetical protein FNYG_08048 [Fusarium nygamai]|uniref:Uncharacterized protein n=1 Tax=Gibberella nygamai TaxID=42673 RepID=A0A2K0W8T8_GIBNY|nr:hypothetical protein FNYG_08048 [Fusarium nygamai]
MASKLLGVCENMAHLGKYRKDEIFYAAVVELLVEAHALGLQVVGPKLEPGLLYLERTE